MRKKTLHMLLMICGLIWFSTHCLAGENEAKDDNLSLSSIFDLEVTSAGKIKQDIDIAPGTISVYSRKDLQDFNRTDLNEVLYSEPGFVPSRDYDRRTISGRGLFEGWNNNHYLLLIDGVPYNDHLYGTAYTWEITPLSFTRSIEVIRGPGSSLYGEYAMNGVISINTLTPEAINNGGEFTLSIGDFGTKSFEAVNGSTGRNFDLVVGAKYYETDGVDQLSYDDSGDNKQRQTRDQRDSNYIFTKLSGKDGLKGLDLQLHYQAWDFQTGHGWFFITPDFAESMHENRAMMSLSYKPEADKTSIQQEYVLRYQRHSIDWNMNYANADTWEAAYPSGMWEYLRTSGDNLFARGQWTKFLSRGGSVLGGVEYSRIEYGGDYEHFTNLNDINDAATANTTNGSMKSIGPWLEIIEDKPINKIGAFAQYETGSMLKELVLTLGVRYDSMTFEYSDFSKADKPTKEKDYNQVSPRLAVVYKPSNEFGMKLMGGSAFRTPTPSEVGGYNTWTLASNIEKLEPEKLQSVELGLFYKFMANLKWDVTLHRTEFENQIAYASISAEEPNLSTNIFSTETAGLESSLKYRTQDINSFFNLSYNTRLGETSKDKGIIPSKDEITWVPAIASTIGASYKISQGYSTALQINHQGEVKRKESDLATVANKTHREDTIPAWTTIDLLFAYKVMETLEASIQAKNLADETRYLAKGGDHPFDYKMEGRRVLFNIKASI